MATLEGQSGGVDSVAFHPKVPLLATSTRYKTQLWDIGERALDFNGGVGKAGPFYSFYLIHFTFFILHFLS